MTRSQSLALLISLALLCACHKTPKNEARSASGEVLQGTISDNMLPLDKLKSQPPLLAPSQEKNTPEGVADKGSGAAGTTTATSGQPDAAPSPAPSASSAP